mgnify:FL=1
MKIIDNNGKTIFKGGFDSTNLIFDANGTDLSEPDKRIRYIDPDIMTDGEVGDALYKIATSVWDYYNGVNEEKIQFFIDLLTDRFDDDDGYYIQAFCEPCVIDYDKMPHYTADEKRMMEEIQNDMLQDVSNDGGGEWAIFNLQLDDAEKVDLLEALACYAK